jgi:Domain of unknown function (DUF4282)
VESQSFFSGLFDFSFKEYITPKVIRVIFVILIIFAGLGALFGLIFAFAGFGRNVAFGLLGVILVVLGFFLSVIFYRIFLEVVSALFRINDNIATLVHLSGGTPTVAPTDVVASIPPPPPSTPPPPPPTVPPPSEPPPSEMPPSPLDEPPSAV